MSRYTHDELCRDWHLWVTHVDLVAQVTREAWDVMSMPERLALVDETFGPQSMSGWDVAYALARGAIQQAWKHADPTEGAREVTDFDDAYHIAIEDPSLLVWPPPIEEVGRE